MDPQLDAVRAVGKLDAGVYVDDAERGDACDLVEQPVGLDVEGKVT